MVQGSVEGAANSASEHERAVQEWFVAERNARHGRDEVRGLYEQHAAGQLDDDELQRRVDESVQLSTATYDWLRAAGWYPGRDIGADAAGCRQLEDAGWVVTPPAEAFLRQYALLDFYGRTRRPQFWVDGREAALNDPADGRTFISFYAEQIGRSLVPVGGQNIMSLSIDETGELWGGVDALYGSLGVGIREMLRTPARMLDRELPTEVEEG